MTDDRDDRDEEYGQSPYRPQDPNTPGQGAGYRNIILIGLVVGAIALAFGAWLGS